MTKKNFLPTTIGKRFLNFVIDFIFNIIFFMAYWFLLGIILWLIGALELIVNLKYLVALSSIFLYYTIFEVIWGKTPAKFITKTRVIKENGEKPGIEDIIPRSITRLIPLNPFSFLFSVRPRGWHDKWSGTLVVDDKEFYKKIKEKGKEDVVGESPTKKQEKFYCSHCGCSISSSANFCSSCGRRT